MRVFLGILILMAVVACGKNDNFRTQGVYPYPGNGYPVVGTPNYQVPSQYPQQFQQFAPMYNYMQQVPQMRQYWPQLWQQWQQYAAYYQYPVYSFETFWYDFCPQYMAPQYYDTYEYFDVNVYVGYW